MLSIFAPGMWVWGFNYQRYIIAGLAYLPWLLSALVLVPPVARVVAPAVAPLGDGFARGATWARGVAFALPAALVLMIPDRVRLVGDFLLRQGAPEAPRPPGPLSAHALPLDGWLHVGWPQLAMDMGVMSAIDASRTLGSLEAGLLGVAAAALPAAMRLGGAPAVGVWSLGVFGGWLGLFTGYGTALAGMGIVVLVAAASVVRIGREGRGLLPFGLALAAGFGLHRSALALLPAFAWAAWRAWGATADDAAERRRVQAALVTPAVALLLFGLPIARGVAAHDAAHLRPAWAAAFSAAAWFTGPRLLDVLNLLLLLVPLALAAPLLFAALRPAGPRRAELAGLAWLAAPFALGLVVLFPRHGPFRGWDFFAPSAIALAALTAWLAGESMRGTRRA
ncbi:MAG: hypothetical protein MUC84_10885, partial [Solirubrobacteraceae bacterium]|nr:hypothetical protein [Solirubrobacteraceae bacterium]